MKNLFNKYDESSLVSLFNNLKTRKDVAEMLEVDENTLIYYVYRLEREGKNYKTFKLNKKTGGYRIINSPVTNLKILQDKLNIILYLVSENRKIIRSSVHGFALGRNIITNASKHVGRDKVLNIDLKDFFPSVNFGRVYKYFLKIGVEREAAVVLAQICCHKYEISPGEFCSSLPQGAPTSPIVSNMICSRMDRQLQELARRNNCRYTRYADDITFSISDQDFPHEIVEKKLIDGEKRILLGNILNKIIDNNYFVINNKKTRIKERFERQEVTGLIVNEKVNIKSKYYKKVRAMLYDWESKGLEEASSRHFQLSSKQYLPGKTINFHNILMGKINFIKDVTGGKGGRYKMVATKFNELSKRDDLSDKNLFVIEDLTDPALSISPDTPATNIIHMISMLKRCKNSICWFDKNFSTEAFDWLIKATKSNKSIKNIRIISVHPDPQNRSMELRGNKRIYKKVKKELGDIDIDCEWRYVDSAYVKDIHMRFVLGDKGFGLSIPPVNAISSGKRDQFSKLADYKTCLLYFNEKWDNNAERVL